jgi:hypothetical protein
MAVSFHMPVISDWRNNLINNSRFIRIFSE